MRTLRWEPADEITRQEELLLKTMKRTKKLFGFLRRRRRELLDDAFQDERAGSPVAQGALHNFRQRLIAHEMDRRLLERTLEVARETKGFDPKKLPASLRIAVEAQASVSHVVGDGTPPPSPGAWSLPSNVRPPRAPFDVALRPNGQPVVADLFNRSLASLDYEVARATAATLDDPRSATVTNLLNDGTGTFKDIQLITSGGELFLGWAKETEAQLWKYDDTDGSFSGIGSLTALENIRGTIALTRVPSGQARLYVRTWDTTESRVRLHWTTSGVGSSDRRIYRARADSDLDGLDMAAAGDDVWLTHPNDLAHFDVYCSDGARVNAERPPLRGPAQRWPIHQCSWCRHRHFADTRRDRKTRSRRCRAGARGRQSPGEPPDD